MDLKGKNQKTLKDTKKMDLKGKNQKILKNQKK